MIMGHHMSHMPLFRGHLEGHIVEVNVAEVFLWEFLPSGRNRVKDRILLNERDGTSARSATQIIRDEYMVSYIHRSYTYINIYMGSG